MRSPRMRKAGRLTAEALDMLTQHVKPGVTTEALDDLVFEFAMAHGAYPAPLDYRGYRKSICTSLNHVVCHGLPEKKPLRDGRRRQHRRHAHCRRLARRLVSHVSGRRGGRAAPNASSR